MMIQTRPSTNVSPKHACKASKLYEWSIAVHKMNGEKAGEPPADQILHINDVNDFHVRFS
jgi:hypothetical protein